MWPIINPFLVAFLSIWGTPDPELLAKSTKQRLDDYTQNKAADPDLEALFCQFGRYLLISCSRPGTLPANLQGVWNHSNRPAWAGDYHSNINVEMNYWPAETANLAECHVPFIDYVDSLREVYAQKDAEALWGRSRMDRSDNEQCLRCFLVGSGIRREVPGTPNTYGNIMPLVVITTTCAKPPIPYSKKSVISGRTT